MTPSPAVGSDIRHQLARIQSLLLQPEPAGMREVELRLTGVIAGIRQGGTTRFDPAVKASVRNIRFLLDAAKRFWDRRRAARAPGLQYSARGALVESPTEPTFALEV